MLTGAPGALVSMTQKVNKYWKRLRCSTHDTDVTPTCEDTFNNSIFTNY